MRTTVADTGPGVPAMSSRAFCPTRTATESAALIRASSSSSERSTTSMMRASIDTRSPGCASRCATRPLMGLRRNGRLVTRPGRFQAGLRSRQGRGRDEPLIDQRPVVAVLALLDIDLGFGRLGLLLRLVPAKAGLAGVDARHFLA